MFDRLLRMLDEHPELVGDVRFETTPTGIVAKSPADLAHGAVIRELRRQLETGLGDRLDVNQDAGFVVAGLKKIPDLFVLDLTTTSTTPRPTATSRAPPGCGCSPR
ncbi:hypothetical protein [Yinghuangia sp. YIM S09857]|uniref:hypothetical protein n=1 Tax=Yinghuangia sp. YIM S09857 TaxID=3436929 RepID=UPI003F5329B0